MSQPVPHKFVILICIVLALASAARARLLDSETTPAGTLISNHAEASYTDDAGTGYASISPTISITVRPVSALVVTPDEMKPSASVAPHERITRLFHICNTGNTPDLYTLTRAEVSTPAQLVNLYFDTDASGTLTNGDTLINLNTTMSPQLAPGACVGVLAVVDTNDVAPASLLSIGVTARSNVKASVNGLAQDDGTITNTVGAGARLTSPDDSNLPPVKLIENHERVTVSQGQTLNYLITFRNSGDVAARRVLVADDLPAGLDYVAGSLRLAGRTLTDAADSDEGRATGLRLEVLLNEVQPGEIVRIAFQARVNSQISAGTGAINNVSLTADNTSPSRTNDAIAIVDPFGTVYAGRTGGGVVINGAHVALLADEASAAPLPTTLDIGFAPNTRNENPFMTAVGGHFNFTLTPAQLGTNAQPARYFINVTAPGYRARMLELTIRPVADNLYNTTVRALDAQPLARAGSFELTNEQVNLANLAAVALNIPMFETNSLEITKAADQPRAEIGDVISYRVEVRNPTAAAVNETIVRDELPPSFHYAQGTALIQTGAGNTRPVEPQATGQTLAFRLGTLAAGAHLSLIYRVRVGVNARVGENFNSAFVEGVFALGESVRTQPARASVLIGKGAFSTRQIIIGRVFEDTNGNGQFDRGERALAGVRLYLENGQSVITDSAGQYNLPSVNDGAVVISLDPITVPAGYMLVDDGGTRSARSWTRLLRTPLGGGSLLHQNFALKLAAGVRRKSADTEKGGDGNVSSSNASPAASREKNESAALPIQSPTTLDSSTIAAEEKDISIDSTCRMQTRKASFDVAGSPKNNAEMSAPPSSGTYETESTETIEPVAPGEVRLISPQPDEIVKSPALTLQVQVAENWSATVEVNNGRVGGTSIGEQRVDHKNKTTTFFFVGLNLIPGPNHIKVTAVSPEGANAHTIEQMAYGRGPAKRLEISSEKKELQASGRDSTVVRVRAYDQWNHPAADAPIMIEATAGRLVRLNDSSEHSPAASLASNDALRPTLNNSDVSATNAIVSEQVNENARQQVVSLSGGEALLNLIADSTTGIAKLHASAGTIEANGEVRFTPEIRPTLLVGLAELTVGRAAPENALRGEQKDVRSSLSLFYRGHAPFHSLFTLAYDSQRPLNRTNGQDRLFQLDPLERAYPIFGDSSTRYQDAQSNSKLYARLDHGRSYALFGDFDTDQSELALAGYSRKLTGVKLHYENSRGDALSLTGARPNTAFTRDVFAGGYGGLTHLTHGDILPGSETVTLEVRDRRNPELVISRETLIRSVDYNLDAASGALLLLRPISAFDYLLNLVQIVVTYEHRADSLSSAVYTARGVKNFSRAGLRLGLSVVDQRQSQLGSFLIGGLDGEKKLPRGGHVEFEWAMSRGRIATNGNVFESGDSEHKGNAYRVELEQPLPFREAVLRADFSRADAGYLNPFGATITAGAQHAGVGLEMKVRPRSIVRFSLLDERNRTANVNNSRLTASLLWTETFTDRLRATFGYDYRNLHDSFNDHQTNSNLVSIGAEWRPTDKLELSAKREQNLGEADPTYPNQTLLAGTYQWTQWARVFFTQRLAAAPIVPISDAGANGFAGTNSRRETAIGVETKLGRYLSMSSRYQLDNGINGTDSFAVLGLQNRLPVSKQLSLDLGFEHGFHMSGTGQSFTGGAFGISWLPTKDLRAVGRYELRDQQGGLGQLITLGAAGRLGDGITTLARLQWSHANFNGRESASLNGTAAAAWRSLERDNVAVLFSYTHRELMQAGATAAQAATRDRSDALSSDGWWQPAKKTELFGRVALKFADNSREGLTSASSLTYLTQFRAQQRLRRAFDIAGEWRMLAQPASHTMRTSFGTELGYWALADLRVAVGYNLTSAIEPVGSTPLATPRGFYFNISTKLSNLFDLFGTSSQGLAANDQADAQRREPPNKQGEKP